MTLEPVYTAEHTKSAYRLYYNWVGWPSQQSRLPEPHDAFFAELASAWEEDGIRLLERAWSPRDARLLFSVKPGVSPILFTARIKGRLQYALRKQALPARFSRKLAMLSVGGNLISTVERYVENQATNMPLADPSTREFLRRFTVVDSTVNLAMPTPAAAGRYWYNLHLVLVTRRRICILDAQRLGVLRDGCLRIAAKHKHQISRLAVMFDHLHIALRGAIAQSPAEIALCYMNNLAFLLRQDALWQPSYYVGTFGHYDLGAIRQAVAGE